MSMPNPLVAIAAELIGGLVGVIRRRHAEANPGAPPLTDAQIFAALHAETGRLVAKVDAAVDDIHRRHPDA